MSYGRVESPWWSEVWIVACGPSARNFDLDRLAGKMVISVNGGIRISAWRHLWAMGDVIPFSADPDWTRAASRAALHFYGPERFLCLALDTNADLDNWDGVTYLQRAHNGGLSDDPAFLETGGNSGYAAINLAYLKQAKEIHLVGYDMDQNARGADGEKFREWAPRFRTMLPQLEARGVKVYNHNPNSGIDAFERCP